jgi:hypothetical protein
LVDADVVDLDVIRVPVSAVGVVDGQDIGVLFTKNLGQTLGGLLDVDVAERFRILVLGRTHHPRIRVMQGHDAIGAQRVGGRLEFTAAALSQRLVFVQQAVGEFTESTVGSGDDYDAVTCVGGHSHPATRSENFVIGMGVETHQDTHSRNRKASYRQVNPSAQ